MTLFLPSMCQMKNQLRVKFMVVRSNTKTFVLFHFICYFLFLSPDSWGNRRKKNSRKTEKRKKKNIFEDVFSRLFNFNWIKFRVEKKTKNFINLVDFQRKGGKKIREKNLNWINWTIHVNCSWLGIGQTIVAFRNSIELKFEQLFDFI